LPFTDGPAAAQNATRALRPDHPFRSKYFTSSSWFPFSKVEILSFTVGLRFHVKGETQVAVLDGIDDRLPEGYPYVRHGKGLDELSEVPHQALAHQLGVAEIIVEAVGVFLPDYGRGVSEK